MVQILTCPTCRGPMFAANQPGQWTCPNCAGGNVAADTGVETPVAATLVPQVDPLEAELAAEDTRWWSERKRYCVRNKFGSLEAPSIGSAIGAFFGGGIPAGYFLFRGLNQFADPSERWYFTLLGVAFAVGTVFYIGRTTYLWASYSVAEGDHQFRRSTIQAKYPANSPRQ